MHGLPPREEASAAMNQIEKSAKTAEESAAVEAWRRWTPPKPC